MNAGRRLWAVLGGAMLLAPVLAWAAGGSAVMESGSGEDRTQVSIEYDGKGKLRMGAQGQGQGQGQGYSVLRDGKFYVVVPQEGGAPMVLDAGAAMQMMGGMVQQMAQTPDVGPANMSGFVSLVDTGRGETVAGVKGSVHVLTYDDENGKRQTEEVVLSSDARARELTTAMTQMGLQMAQAMGQNAAVDADAIRLVEKAYGGKGVLRYGAEFRIVSFGDAPAGNRFELPAAPTQLPNLQGLGGLLGGQAGADGQTGGQTGGQGSMSIEQILGGKAQRQQDRVEGRADQEVDEATDKAVDKVLDKAFEKLFGG